MNKTKIFQSRQHESGQKGPSSAESRDSRDYHDSSRDSTLRSAKEMIRRRDRAMEIDEREQQQRDRKSKSPVQVEHWSTSEDKQQRPRSSQELKHPRSPVLNGVIFPLLSDVIIIFYSFEIIRLISMKNNSFFFLLEKKSFEILSEKLHKFKQSLNN